jgi:hypothetical protein
MYDMNETTRMAKAPNGLFYRKLVNQRPTATNGCNETSYTIHHNKIHIVPTTTTTNNDDDDNKRRRQQRTMTTTTNDDGFNER